MSVEIQQGQTAPEPSSSVCQGSNKNRVVTLVSKWVTPWSTDKPDQGLSFPNVYKAFKLPFTPLSYRVSMGIDEQCCSMTYLPDKACGRGSIIAARS